MEKVYATTRRPKWQCSAAVPAPKILHLPHRLARRKTARKAAPSGTAAPRRRTGKLEALFEQERSFSRGVVPIVVLSGGEGEEKGRIRVEEREGVEAEKWRFQAEMLRAECNLLRMEKEIAVRKMERRGVQLERTLKSAAHTLISLRCKVSEGTDVSLILEEEISDLVEKLEKLQERSGHKEVAVKKCNNFDKQVNLLRKRLDRFGGISNREMCVRDIQDMSEASLPIKPSSQADENFDSARDSNVEILSRKMEGMSNSRLLEKVEQEYGSMLSTANSSASNSKRIEFPDTCLSLQQSHEEKKFCKQKSCSGHCKAVVQRIVEQVRAETEQWSQMQEMLGQVRDEIEELHASRDFWEDRALDSDYEIQSLHFLVKEWRQKAISSEEKANELQEQVLFLCGEVERLRREKKREAVMPKDHQPVMQEAQIETEKRVLVCLSKENDHKSDVSCKHEISNEMRKAQLRPPLQGIQNLLPLSSNHRSKAGLHCLRYKDNSKGL